MITKQAQSLLDFIMKNLPDKFRSFSPSINDIAADTLFDIWKEDKHFIDKDLIAKSAFIADKINLLEKEGLVKNLGNSIRITQKGKDIIKTIILGDERSSYEDDGENINYSRCLANIKLKKRMTKKASVDDSYNWFKTNVIGN